MTADDQQRSTHEGEHIETAKRHLAECYDAPDFPLHACRTDCNDVAYALAEIARLTAQVEAMRAVVEPARVLVAVYDETWGCDDCLVGAMCEDHEDREYEAHHAIATAVHSLDGATPGVQMAEMERGSQ